MVTPEHNGHSPGRLDHPNIEKVEKKDSLKEMEDKKNKIGGN